MRRKNPVGETPKPPLRLEWIEAGSLTENPANWRRHSKEQLATLRDLVEDPEIGWAGACLFNERTRRLIDGHARKTVVDPKTPVPVLVGDWSEEAERKILMTLDPVGAMAAGDREAYEALLAQTAADSLWVRDLMHATLTGANADGEEQDGATENGDPQALIPEMECQPWEHHNYVVLMFNNDQDWQQACERLGIGPVKITYPGGLVKVGVGRVVDGAKAMARLTGDSLSHNTHNPNDAPQSEQVRKTASAASAPSASALTGSKTRISADAQPTAPSSAATSSASAAPARTGGRP